MERNQELETFKLLPINKVCAAFGFRLIRKKSSPASAVMEKGDHKIVCSTAKHDGHGILFTIGGGDTSGSAIDLAIHIFGGSIGHARKHLRPLLSAGSLDFTVAECGGKLKPVSVDFLSVLARFSAYPPIEARHPYLCDVRNIPLGVLLHKRFRSRIRHDPINQSAIFAHYGSPDGSNDRCLTGFEIKGEGVTMFSKSGRKGLFPSNAFEVDDRLVIAEASIDALSFGALECDLDRTRFISISGTLNQDQPGLIASAIKRLPRGEVVLALDHDQGGAILAESLTKVFQGTGRTDLALRVHSPEQQNLDWNDVLKLDGIP